MTINEQQNKIIIRGNENYKASETQTQTAGNYKKKDSDWKNEAVGLINKLPLHRYFITLAFVVYGVIAFSKREKGVTPNDLSMFFVFICFILLIFIFLAIGRDVYRGKGNLIDLQNFIGRHLKKIILILFILIFSFIVFKKDIGDLISQFIKFIK